MEKTTQLPLSVVIIARDEEQNIQGCLDSVSFAKDVFVLIDDRSQDQTENLAIKMGARVMRGPWLGFGPQKKHAVKNALQDWVLCLDADERVTAELRQEIFHRFPTLNETYAYAFPRLSKFLGKDIYYGGWYPDHQTRFFHRKFHNWNEASIHEQVETDHRHYFHSPLQHLVFTDLSAQIKTNDRYSSLLAQKDFDGGKRAHVFNILLKPFIKFVECYFLKQGFRDGLPGFIIAINAAHSMFLRQTKLWEKLQCSDKKN